MTMSGKTQEEAREDRREAVESLLSGGERVSKGRRRKE